MRVGIEAVGNRAGGGGVVLVETLKALLREPKVTEAVVYCLPREARGFDLPKDTRLRAVEMAGPDKSMAERLKWLLWGLQARARQDRLDRLLLMNGIGRPPAGCKTMAFVQQALPLTPSAIAAARLSYRLRLRVLRWLCKGATTRADMTAVQRPGMRALMIEQFGLRPERVEVFEPGPPEFPAAASASAEKLKAMDAAPTGERLLYVGNNEPHKNLGLAVRAVEEMAGRGMRVTLFATCARPAGVADSALVRWLGFLDRGELRRAYELATILVMPSKVESLGLPLLEAMALGVPIAAANLSYARDVCDEAALYFDADSASDAAQKIESLLKDAGLRERLRATGLEMAGARAGKDPYKAMARRLME